MHHFGLNPNICKTIFWTLIVWSKICATSKWHLPCIGTKFLIKLFVWSANFCKFTRYVKSQSFTICWWRHKCKWIWNTQCNKIDLKTLVHFSMIHFLVIPSWTRFGKISPLWHNVKTLWPFWKCSFSRYLPKLWAYFGKCVMLLANWCLIATYPSLSLYLFFAFQNKLFVPSSLAIA